LRADPGQFQREAAAAQQAERVVDLLRLMARDLADEAQGEVVILRRHPARAVKPASQGGQAFLQEPGEVEGDEESHGGGTSEFSVSMRGCRRGTSV